MRDNVGAILINSGRIRRPIEIAYARSEIVIVFTRFLLLARLSATLVHRYRRYYQSYQIEKLSIIAK